MTVLYAVIAFALGFTIAWFLKTQKKPGPDIETLKHSAVLETEKTLAVNNNATLQTQIEKLQQQLREISNEAAAKDARVGVEMNNAKVIREQLQRLEQRFNEATETINNLGKQKSYVDAELKYKNEQLVTQKTEIESIGKKFETEFKVLAQNILNEKAEAFDKHQEKSLTVVLKPLKDHIEEFKKEIGGRYDNETRERASLKEQIKNITEANKQLSEQANNLTNALLGQVKQQGDWGEMILESILEHAGLTKDLHYTVQGRVADEEGKTFLPDILVKYPDGRLIVVDSKVSLVHYYDYCNCKDAEQQAKCLQQLINSIYSHINNLSGKDYQQKTNALDFVMLFIPIEGAYITAMQNDIDMWRKAYNKKVVIMSPTNLIPAMKLVYDLWKKEDINKNAEVIRDKAIKIYEKLAAFLEDFEKVGAQIQKTAAIFNDAEKKLHTGKGNLLSQANQMKINLKHTNPTRELPKILTEQGIVEDEMPDEITNQQ